MAHPRILGGSARGRRLETPRHGTRPSPSRVREALFDMLAFRPKERFLDLYSGSGAVGLEAASRGWQATCVDSSRDATEVIRRNARRLGLDVTIRRDDALRFAERTTEPYQVVFAAPPYPDDLEAIYARLLASGAAAPGGLYIFQHPSRLELAQQLPPGWTARTRAYGSNALTIIEVPNFIETSTADSDAVAPAEEERDRKLS